MVRMYERLLEPKVREALSDTPVVLIVGPRQDHAGPQDWGNGPRLYHT